MRDLSGELASVEARVVASKNDIATHRDALNAGITRLVKSPYVIGGALISTAAAGYFVFRRRDRLARPPLQTSGEKVLGLLKMTATLLPLIGVLSARMNEKNDKNARK